MICKRFAFALAIAAIALAACGGAGSKPSASPTCGPPIPVPAQTLLLVYPVPGATSVPIAARDLVFSGFASGFYGTDTVNLTSGSNTIPVGAFTAPPSPLPTPNALPSGASGNVPLVAAPIPTLSPATTYTVAYSYGDYADNPAKLQSNLHAAARLVHNALTRQTPSARVPDAYTGSPYGT